MLATLVLIAAVALVTHDKTAADEEQTAATSNKNNWYHEMIRAVL